MTRRGPIGDPTATALFVGPEAATADQNALAEAKRLTDAGMDPGAVWLRTGWGQRAPGDWVTEIDDRAAQVVRSGRGHRLEHPEIDAAYPQHRPTQSVLFMSPNALVRALRKTGDKPFEDSELYGFTDGGTAYATNEPDFARDSAVHELQHLIRTRYQGQPYVGGATRGAYMADPHEMEARAVEQRIDMTPDQRRQMPPSHILGEPVSTTTAAAGRSPMNALMRMRPVSAGRLEALEGANPDARTGQGGGGSPSEMLNIGYLDLYPQQEPVPNALMPRQRRDAAPATMSPDAVMIIKQLMDRGFSRDEAEAMLRSMSDSAGQQLPLDR